MGAAPAPVAAPMPDRRSRPVGAVVAQFVVAGSSLLLAIVALRELGTAGLGTFSLLFGVLITATAVQTGWIGDSLTVLDRFDPGVRRALWRSQVVASPLILATTAALGAVLTDIDGTTAIVFGVASAVWALEETLRRVLMARREFWQLVANDVAFAAGAFGLLGAVVVSGAAITIQTMLLALIAGAVVAIALAVVQLPRVELVPGPAAHPRLRELGSFAGWRALQVGLRPGGLAAVRAVVAVTAGIEAVGQLEAARLLIAPALTVVNGAGAYLLPTYARQVRDGAPRRPAVGRAMLVVAAVAAVWSLAAVAFGPAVLDLLTTSGATDDVTIASIAAWGVFAVGFGLGLPAGAATVASGRSRSTFGYRTVDAVVGVVTASALAALGLVSLVPLGLGAGAFVGAMLLYRALRGVHGPPGPLDTGGAIDAAPAAAPRARAPVARRAGGRSLSALGAHTDLLWIAPLVLIVAIDWKLRRRAIDDALSGSIDLQIAAELAICAVVGIWSLTQLVPQRPRFEPLVMIVWGYVLTTAVSALYSAFPMLAAARAVQLVIIGAVIHLLATRGDLTTVSRLLHGWIVLITASIAAGLLYVAPTTGPQEGRFTWFSVHSVTAGSMLAVSVPVLVGLWAAAGRRPMPWPRSVYGALLLIHAVALLATRTRGSIGGAAVAVVVIAWLWSGRRARPGLVLGGLVVGGGLAIAFGRPILEFLMRGETADQIATFNRRTEIWSLAWDAFRERPLFGYGFNSAKGVFFDETGLGGAHNALLNVMIDVGAVGLAWWFALIGASLVLLAQVRRRERRARTLHAGALGSAHHDAIVLIGVFTALLVNGITTEGVGAGVNVAAIWLFIGAAWLTILDRTTRTVDAPIRDGRVPTGVR